MVWFEQFIHLEQTNDPTPEQIQAATAMLANTAQNLLDNNMGVIVPYFSVAEEFLQQLKIDYFQQHGTLNLASTGADANTQQQLFYASVEEKNMPWINQGSASSAVTGLIIRTPIKPLSEQEAAQDKTRDRLTGRPLDEKGRYSLQISVDGTVYEPKFHSCATAECMAAKANFDMSDKNTQAYIKAVENKALKDFGDAAKVVIILGTGSTVAAPVVGIAKGVDYATTLVTVVRNDKYIEQLLNAGGNLAAEEYMVKVWKIPKPIAQQIVTSIDLVGGWRGFEEKYKAKN